MKLLAAILSIVIFTLIIFTTRSRPPAKPSSLTEVEAYLTQAVTRNHPPGLTISVVSDKDVLYQHAFGLADGPKELIAADDTVYHWWSMTKVATAIAVLKLHDAGQLDIDNPVKTYLPFFEVHFDGQTAPPVTIRQLLRHTSGLADPMPAMIGWVHYQDEILSQSMLLQEHLPKYSQLKFTPDSKSAYSNLGYMVLGAVIEAVSGQSYETFIQDLILRPLGMNTTSFLYTPQMKGRIAAGSHPITSLYTPLLPFLLDMDQLVNRRSGSLLWFNPVYIDATPSTGLLGSAEEAALLAQALLGQQDLLTKESHALMLPQGNGPTGRPLGWAEYADNGRLWVQHRGGGPGFATIMRLYPQENLAVVIMANNTNLPAETLVEALANLDW